jgi:hypothetical protein
MVPDEYRAVAYSHRTDRSSALRRIITDRYPAEPRQTTELFAHEQASSGVNRIAATA